MSSEAKSRDIEKEINKSSALDNVYLNEEDDIDEVDINNGNCSDSDSIDTLELLKESTEIANLNALEASQDDLANDDETENETETNSRLESVKSSINNDSTQLDNLNVNYKEIAVKSQDSQEQNAQNEEAKPAIEYKTHFSYGFDDDDEIKTDDLKHLEPKLRDAWIEMRRLDKVLKRVTDREKRVKLETKKLIENYRVELDLLKMTSDRKESKQEQENTANYLALSNLDKNDDEEDEGDETKRDSLTPLFKTQLPEGFEGQEEFEELEQLHDEKKTEKGKKFSRNQSVASSVSSIDIENKNDNIKGSTSSLSKSKSRAKSNGKTSSITGNVNKKSEKDFIKRNIKLAQDAGGTLAMTEDEKKRLDELLVEDEKNEKEFVIEYDEKTQTHNQIVDYNPLEIRTAAGEGFQPTIGDQQRMFEIDSRLESRNYSRLLTGSRNAGTTSATAFTNSASSILAVDSETYRSVLAIEQKKIKLNDEFDENEFGDKFIREARISREQESRLKYIDSQLESIRSPSQATVDSATERASTSSISLINQEQLQSLLDECSLSNKSVVSMIHNHKLGTLKEEDNDNLNDLSTIDEFNDENNQEPEIEITENVIKALIDQAKNEGIVPFQNELIIGETTNETSFYEQAMSVLNEKPPILKEFKFELDIEYQKIDVNEEPVDGLKLPKLEASNTIDDSNKLKLRRQSENANVLSRASSAASNINGDNNNNNENNASLRDSVASPSQSFLPKIDSRYLPNNSK